MIQTEAQAPGPTSCFYQARGNPTISFSFEETTNIQINVKSARGSGVPIQILPFHCLGLLAPSLSGIQNVVVHPPPFLPS